MFEKLGSEFLSGFPRVSNSQPLHDAPLDSDFLKKQQVSLKVLKILF
jgi:hypothetical protein